MSIQLATINRLLRCFGLILVVDVHIDMPTDSCEGSVETTIRLVRVNTWIRSMA